MNNPSLDYDISVEKIKSFFPQNESKKPPTVYKVTEENGTYVFICDINRNSAEVIVATLSLNQDFATLPLTILGSSLSIAMLQQMGRSIRQGRLVNNLTSRTPLDVTLKDTFSHFQQQIRDFGNLLSYTPKTEKGQPQWSDVTRAQIESFPQWLNNRDTRKVFTRAFYENEDSVSNSHLSQDVHRFFENFYTIFCVEDHATSDYVWDSTSIQKFLADENTRKYLEEFEKFVDEQKIARTSVDETVRAWIELKDLTVPSSRISSLREPGNNGQRDNGQRDNGQPVTYYLAVDLNSTVHQERRYEAIDQTQLLAKIEQGFEIFHKDINGQYLKVTSTAVQQERNQQQRGSSQLKNMRLLIDRGTAIQRTRPVYSNPLYRFVSQQLGKSENEISERDIRSFLEKNIIEYGKKNPENLNNLFKSLLAFNKSAQQDNTARLQDLYHLDTIRYLVGTVELARPITTRPPWLVLGQFNWITIIIPIVGSTFWFFKWKIPFHRQREIRPSRTLPGARLPLNWSSEIDWKKVVTMFNEQRKNSVNWVQKNVVQIVSVSSFVAGWLVRRSPFAVPLTLISATGQRANVTKILKAFINLLTKKGGS